MSSNTETTTTEKCIKKIFDTAKEKGMGIGKLEEEIGQWKGYFSRLRKNDSKIPADILKLVADKLNVSVDYLMSDGTVKVSREDIICHQFMERLTSETKNRQRIWTPYRIENEEDCSDEDIPQFIRDKYRNTVEQYCKMNKEHSIDVKLESLVTYISDIDEMDGMIVLFCYEKKVINYSYQSQEPYDEDTWVLCFFDGNKLNGITFFSTITQSNDPLQFTLNKLVNAVTEMTNLVNRKLIAKMSAYLANDVER